MEENENGKPVEEQPQSVNEQPLPSDSDNLMPLGVPPQPVVPEVAAQPPLKRVGFFKRDLGLSSVTGGLAYSLAVLLYIGMSFLLVFIIRLAKIDTDGDAFVYVSSLISPLAICITLAIILPARKVKFKQIFPVKAHPKYYLMSVLMVFGLIFIGSIVSGIFLKILEVFGYKAGEGFMPDVSGVKIIPAIIFMALMPAFFEELLFRGIILHCAEQSMGSVRAILVTGFCFALMHGSPQQTVHQFMLGCMLALLTIRSGSVLPAMLTHFLNNLIAVVMLALSDSIESAVTLNTPTTGEMLLSLAIYAAIGAAIGMLIWLINDRKRPMLAGKNGGVTTFFTGASVGIAIMGIMWLLDLFGI